MTKSWVMKHLSSLRTYIFAVLLACLVASAFSVVALDDDAQALGGNDPLNLPVPVTALAMRPQEDGAWGITSDGGVFTYGNADFYGAGNAYINNVVVAAFSSPSGMGYSMITNDGGVFNFGNADFFGSGNAFIRNQVVSAFPSPSGNGYTMVTDDGGVFTFGDAQNFGTGNAFIKNAVMSAFSSPTGNGYTLVTDDGGVFTFGDAQNFGTGNAFIKNQVVSAFRTHTGNGYWMVTDDGGTFTFGDAQGLGTSNSCPSSRIAAGQSSKTSMKFWTVSSQGELREFPTASPIRCVAPAISVNGACAGNSLPKRIIISIGEQHLWACERSVQVYDSAVVTGAFSKGTPSPTGTFKIYAKQTNTYLVGQGYRAGVRYWMPFLRGYGLHDASWRNIFGVRNFGTVGSHGCINLPLSTAKYLFGWTSVGTTVTLH